MGDVGHVVDFIVKNYPGKGVEYQSEGDGVLWVTPPPKLRDVNLFYAELSALDDVIAIDQNVDGNSVRIKIMVGDNLDIRRRVVEESTPYTDYTSGTPIKSGSARACRCFQSYIGSTTVLLGLAVSLAGFYWRPILRFLEAAYLLSQDEPTTSN